MTSTVRRQSGQPHHREMLQKPHLHETFFSLKNAGQQRPMSVATEFMESDYDDDEILSDPEDGETSPRISLNSSGQPSMTTLSSYEEAQTPRSSRARSAFQVETESLRQVEGPRGPHLFRSSSLSVQSLELQNALSLSPVTPKAALAGPPVGTEYHLPISLDLTQLPNSSRRRDSGPFRFTMDELDTCDLADWSPEMVAQQMLNVGIELGVAERFVENDITGAILITLRFEDLKELGIPSFGVRTQIWDEIHAMRNMRAASPDPETPIEDEPDREVKREQRAQDGEDSGKPKRKPSRRQRPNDIVSPLESVSIVGIEQMMPKPHHCKKGENCAKWRRNQRMIEAFKKDHPFVDMEKGGVIMIAGDPGNATTATSLHPRGEDFFRPTSDAIPSVVASSDIMGTDGLAPLQYLQEAALRNVQAQDPQDNVRQFLSFQQRLAGSDTVPPTPPFEVFPQQQESTAHSGLRRTLPKLAIPGQQMQMQQQYPARPSTTQPSTLSQVQNSVDYSVESSPDATPTAVYRFGTPFSEMDVPLTAVPLGPVARDASQSVPPDMNYRAPIQRSMSRMSHRRPSIPVLPVLDENRVAYIGSPPPAPVPAPINNRYSPTRGPRQLHAPPRVQYQHASSERAIAPLPGSAVALSGSATVTPLESRIISPNGPDSGRIGVSKDAEGVTYHGAMKKRKTKMLRHEWHEHYFTLKGTRLAMHKDAADVGRTLEYVDVDDYAIACSGLASTSKLNAAFKAMNIRRGGDGKKEDVAAFSFQLIPQDPRGAAGAGGRLLRKRESSFAALGLPSSSSSLGSSSATSGGNPAGEGVNGTGKSHHFAVKSRDDRIDWMRELMLAKAMKQKGAGFEVSVNGNMI